MDERDNNVNHLIEKISEYCVRKKNSTNYSRSKMFGSGLAQDGPYPLARRGYHMPSREGVKCIENISIDRRGISIKAVLDSGKLVLIEHFHIFYFKNASSKLETYLNENPEIRDKHYVKGRRFIRAITRRLKNEETLACGDSFTTIKLDDTEVHDDKSSVKDIYLH